MIVQTRKIMHEFVAMVVLQLTRLKMWQDVGIADQQKGGKQGTDDGIQLHPTYL